MPLLKFVRLYRSNRLGYNSSQPIYACNHLSLPAVSSQSPYWCWPERDRDVCSPWVGGEAWHSRHGWTEITGKALHIVAGFVKCQRKIVIGAIDTPLRFTPLPLLKGKSL
jgi:hypothetical protein